jgi:hypothetical protein
LRSASVCHAHRTAAVPQLGAKRLLPHQRHSRKALHVVNYVTEHAPVAYKELSVGKCRLGTKDIPRLTVIRHPAVVAWRYNMGRPQASTSSVSLHP